MTIRRTMALLLALAGCGEVSTPSHDPGCLEGDGGVCPDEASSAQSELRLGQIGGGIVPPLPAPPGVQVGVGDSFGCLAGALDPRASVARPVIRYRASGVAPLARAQLCRDGECFWSETFSEATYDETRYVRDPNPTVFTPSYPLPRITYTGRASDRAGRYSAVDRVVKVGPSTDFELLDTVQVRGPRLGAGVRHFDVHWRGVNVYRVCMSSAVGGVRFDGSTLVCVELPASDWWGPSERITSFSVSMTEESARLLFAADASPGRGPIILAAASDEIDDCVAESRRSYHHLDWGSTTALRRGSDSTGPRPVWMPECRSTCESTSPTGWIRTSTRHASACASGLQHEVCRHDDRQVGELLSVCASEPIPSGWDDLGVRESEDRCGGGPAAVRLIQRGD